MENVMPLHELEQGRVAALAFIDNIDLSKRKRLIELGFFRGAKIKMLVKKRSIAIVGIRGYAMSLDKTLLERIFVFRGKNA